MSEKLDLKRILIFVGFAFGLAWIIGLIVYLTGGLENSPELIPGSKITLAVVLLAVGYMGAPAVANLLTRLVTREGWQETWLRPKLKQGWPYWVAGWVVPSVMTILGAVAFFALFPQYFDPSLTQLQDMMAQASAPVSINPWLIVVIQTLTGILISPLVNSLFTFGEEFGWRGYLLQKLLPLGERKAMILLGVIWGVWHWPVIAMGHNYGLDYAGAPWLGMLAMVWFTFVIGTFLCWITLRGGSVWPAVIGHAAINGISALGAMVVQGEPNPLLGPMPVGLIGAAAWALLAAWIMAKGVAPKAAAVVEA